MADGTFLPSVDFQQKGPSQENAQQLLGKGLRQGQHALIDGGEGVGKVVASFFIGGEKRAQQLQHLIAHLVKAHPFRLEGEALAKDQGRAMGNGIQQLGNAFDHIQPVLANAHAEGVVKLTIGGQGYMQGNLHANAALLRQGGIHGGKQRGGRHNGGCVLQPVQDAGLLGGQPGGKDMSAFVLAKALRAGAACPSLGGKENTTRRPVLY